MESDYVVHLVGIKYAFPRLQLLLLTYLSKREELFYSLLLYVHVPSFYLIGPVRGGIVKFKGSIFKLTAGKYALFK